MSNSKEDKLYGVIGATIGILLIAGLMFGSGLGLYSIMTGEAGVMVFLVTIVLILITIVFGGFLLILVDASRETKAPFRRKIEVVRSIESLLGYDSDTYIGLDKSPMDALIQLESDLKRAFFGDEQAEDSHVKRSAANK